MCCSCRIISHPKDFLRPLATTREGLCFVVIVVVSRMKMSRWFQYRIISIFVWTLASFLLYFWYSYVYYEGLIRHTNEMVEIDEIIRPITDQLEDSHVKQSYVDETDNASVDTNYTTSETTTMIIPATTTMMTTTLKTTTPNPMEVYHFANEKVVVDGPVNPHPFTFTMNPSKLCKNLNVFLLVYIHSHPDNFDRRQIVRETWGNVSLYEKQTVIRVFVMGQTENTAHKHLLKMESLHYNDIIQEDFLDTYRNLTYKAVGALKWVTTYCSHAKMILKADDDAFVNMFVLLRHLQSRLKHGSYGQRTLACNAWYKSKVDRNGKWAVSVAERRHPFWPTFCQGLAYIMSPDVVSALYTISFDVPYLWMDDVYVTGFLAMKLGIQHHQITRMFVPENDLIRFISGSHWYKCLFSHVKNLNVTVSMWDALLSKPGLPL